MSQAELGSAMSVTGAAIITTGNSVSELSVRVSILPVSLSVYHEWFTYEDRRCLLFAFK